MTDEIPQTTADHGAWGYNEDTRTLTYLVSGKGADIDDNNNPATRDIQLRVSFSGLKISLDMLKGAPNSNLLCLLLVSGWKTLHICD